MIKNMILILIFVLLPSICFGAKYKEQRDGNNELIGYTRIADNACIPISQGNRDYQDVLKWIADGNTPDPDDTLLKRVKNSKIKEYKIEAVRRIGLQVPEWDNLEIVSRIASVWNMLGTPNAEQLKARNIYVYVKDTAIPNVKAISNVDIRVAIQDVQAIDVSGDTNWP